MSDDGFRRAFEYDLEELKAELQEWEQLGPPTPDVRMMVVDNNGFYGYMGSHWPADVEERIKKGEPYREVRLNENKVIRCMVSETTKNMTDDQIRHELKVDNKRYSIEKRLNKMTNCTLRMAGISMASVDYFFRPC